VPKIDNGKIQVGDVRVLNGTQFDQWRKPFEARLWRTRRTEHTRALLADYVRAGDEYRAKKKVKSTVR
jgi:hypothetical protein